MASLIDLRRSAATRRGRARPLFCRIALAALLATKISCGTEAGSTPSVPGGVSRGNARVFVIVLENRGFSEALRQPYIAQLASQYAQLTNYHAVAHGTSHGGPTWRAWATTAWPTACTMQ